jgi:outer membrane receptor protein involved in Fe transport
MAVRRSISNSSQRETARSFVVSASRDQSGQQSILPKVSVHSPHAYTLTNLRLRLANVDATWNVDLYVDNLFDEVAIGRVLSSPFGFASRSARRREPLASASG